MNRVIEYLKDQGTKQNIVKMIENNLYLFQQVDADEKIQSYSGSLYNHFRRSHMNQDADKETYKKKYEEILKSLIINGLFIYTPSIKQIENEINTSNYSVTYYENMRDRNLDTVVIRRLL